MSVATAPIFRRKAVQQFGRSLEDEFGKAVWEDSPHPAERELLVRSAWFLELLTTGLAASEAWQMLDLRSSADLHARRGEWLEATQALAGLDFDALFEETQRFAPDLLMPEPRTQEEWNPEALFGWLRAPAEWLLRLIPIEQLTSAAVRIDDAVLQHRLTMAHERLCGMVRRMHPTANRALAAIGRFYAAGRLSLVEAAEALQMSVEDTVAAFEVHGIARRLDVIRLGDEERKTRWARLREQREGQVAGQAAAELVRRDVIASQRIEGIDARIWMPRRS